MSASADREWMAQVVNFSHGHKRQIVTSVQLVRCLRKESFEAAVNESRFQLQSYFVCDTVRMVAAFCVPGELSTVFFAPTLASL